jgi:hypothetical protein
MKKTGWLNICHSFRSVFLAYSLPSFSYDVMSFIRSPQGQHPSSEDDHPQIFVKNLYYSKIQSYNRRWLNGEYWVFPLRHDLR